jgi:hypothetical protein
MRSCYTTPALPARSAASGSVAIENKQAGRRHGGIPFVPGSPIRFLFEIDRQSLMQANAALSLGGGFFSSFARWRQLA